MEGVRQGLIATLAVVGWLAVGNLTLRYMTRRAEKRGRDMSQADVILDKAALEAKPLVHPAVTVAVLYLLLLASWPAMWVLVVTAKPREDETHGD